MGVDATTICSTDLHILNGDLAGVHNGRILGHEAVGTVDEVREQVAEWDALGVDTLILGVGAVPFQIGALDDVEFLLHACAGS